MTIVSAHPHEESAGDDDRDGGPVRPFTVFAAMPSPLSNDLDEIVAYMHLIGERCCPGRTTRLR